MIALDTRKSGAVPFWFWNGDQREDELTRQLELAAEGGLKGLAIHARNGNRTEYMSDRWIELTRHCCREALRLGLDIWLYDEEGFPSGSVGQRLPAEDPAHRQKHLRYGYTNGGELRNHKNVLAVFDAGTYARISPDGAGDKQAVLAFEAITSASLRIVDMLRRETSERFIEMTHAKYHEALGEFFGKPITHVFTDDVASLHGSEPRLPFTERLPEAFTERTGCDFFDSLPKLVENLPGSARARLDFRGLVLDMFLEECIDPMYKWCDEHGVRFTGHLCGDEGPIDKVVLRLGACMPFYEHEHVPGVDDFLCSTHDSRYLDTLRNPQGHCPAILLKQASSVANQLKEGACNAEALTYLGWGAAVSGQSAFLNYELALGVNVFTHHDFSYATAGVAKRDCPPSYFFQQPYWERYRQLHDTIARSTQLLTRGKYDASVLVIHPMTSCWIAQDGSFPGNRNPFVTRHASDFPAPQVFEDCLAAVSHELLGLHVGFEYGDEGILARHGRVDGPALRVGDMRYTTVVVPEVSNLMGPTVELLRRFEEAGGRVVAVNPSGECLVDGELPASPVFGGQLDPDRIAAPEYLRDISLTPSIALSVAEPDAPVVCHSRVVDGAKEHFVFNVSDRPQTIEWPEDLRAYDPLSNVTVETAARRLTLPPFHAMHLLPDAPEDVTTEDVEKTLFATGAGGMAEEIPRTRWRVVPELPNLMLIDWCRLESGEVVKSDHELPPDAGPATCRVTVDIPEAGRVSAIVGEESTLRGIRVNGGALPGARERHPSSQDMLTAGVGGLLKSGLNEITFRGPDGPRLFEPFYLAGDFGVDLVETDGGMRPGLASLRPGLGDLVEQGLPFYWGGVCYETELPRDPGAEWLDCGRVDGVLTLSVNGVEVGCRYMAPYRFRIAEHMTEESNKIVLALYNTAQNLFGPHRRLGRDAMNACTRRGEGEGAYHLAGFGMHGPVRIERKR